MNYNRDMCEMKGKQSRYLFRKKPKKNINTNYKFQVYLIRDEENECCDIVSDK